MAPHQLAVAAPRPQVAERDDVHERAREVGVVGRVGVLAEARQRPRAHLVGDAARLLVAPVEDAVRLQPAEARERAVEHGAAVEHRRLPACGQRVAAEERRVERHARLQRQPLVGLAFELREGGEVLDGAGEDALDERVAGRAHHRQPVAPDLAGAHARNASGLVERAVGVVGVDAQLELDLLAGCETQRRHEAIALGSRRAGAAHRHGGLEGQVGMLVTEAHRGALRLNGHLRLLLPLAVVRFEQVGVVGGEDPRHLERHLAPRPVRDA